ncbi:hypothetical protein ScalyP_jg1101, partial [Parmales sp. scaly parma]
MGFGSAFGSKEVTLADDAYAFLLHPSGVVSGLGGFSSPSSSSSSSGSPLGGSEAGRRQAAAAPLGSETAGRGTRGGEGDDVGSRVRRGADPSVWPP